MNITMDKAGETLNVALEGRVDTVNAPQLQAAMEKNLKGVREIRYDMSGVEYISSSGLRVLLYAHQHMALGGNTVVTNANDIVRKVIDVTGLAGIFEIV